MECNSCECDEGSGRQCTGVNTYCLIWLNLACQFVCGNVSGVYRLSVLGTVVTASHSSQRWRLQNNRQMFWSLMEDYVTCQVSLWSTCCVFVTYIENFCWKYTGQQSSLENIYLGLIKYKERLAMCPGMPSPKSCDVAPTHYIMSLPLHQCWLGTGHRTYHAVACWRVPTMAPAATMHQTG